MFESDAQANEILFPKSLFRMPRELWMMYSPSPTTVTDKWAVGGVKQRCGEYLYGADIFVERGWR